MHRPFGDANHLEIAAAPLVSICLSRLSTKVRDTTAPPATTWGPTCLFSSPIPGHQRASSNQLCSSPMSGSKPPMTDQQSPTTTNSWTTPSNHNSLGSKQTRFRPHRLSTLVRHPASLVAPFSGLFSCDTTCSPTWDFLSPVITRQVHLLFHLYVFPFPSFRTH